MSLSTGFSLELVDAAVQNIEHLDSIGSILSSLPVFSDDNAKAIFDILQTVLGKARHLDGVLFRCYVLEVIVRLLVMKLWYAFMPTQRWECCNLLGWHPQYSCETFTRNFMCNSVFL